VLPKGSRFFGWLVFVAFCSVFVTAFAFPVGLRRPHLNLAVFSVHREHVTVRARRPLTDRILARLAEAEARELDPWRRDDLRIAWITVLNASRGESAPHFWATYQVLGTSPDQVWPRIVANRKAKLGALYDEIYGADADAVSAAPKKPAQSVRWGQRAKSATA